MRISYLQILFFTLIVCTLQSCCKSNKCQCDKVWGVKVDDCTPKHYGPYPLGAAYDYLYFKPGSWWVYRNSLSGETDSIYMVYCDTAVFTRTGDYSRWLSVTYTSLAFGLRSDIYDVDYKYTRTAANPDATNFYYSQVQDRTALKSSGSTSGPYSVFRFPFNDGGSTDFVELIPVLNINGKDYPEVAVFQTTGPDFTIQLPEKNSFGVTYGGLNKYYWSKKYGLVQIESKLNRTSDQSVVWQKWELLKHNIIQ